MKLRLIIFHAIRMIPLILGVDVDKCRDPLGMESRDIPDSALTSSSSYDDVMFGPANARIRGGGGGDDDGGGRAWCPKGLVSKDVYEWVEINLGSLKVIAKIETQGHLTTGHDSHEYVEAYFVEYKRSDEGQWKRFRNRAGTEVFMGNLNAHSVVGQDVVPLLVARRIRIVPYSNLPRRVCLRLELYGCQWSIGLMSYSLPQGVTRGFEVDLYDQTYDGQETLGHLSGGLGQLTDGILGNSNFRLDSEGLGRKGYGWIGWKSDSATPPPVEAVFQFESERNLTGFRVHANNQFSKEVRVCRRVVVEIGSYDDDEDEDGVKVKVVVTHDVTRDDVDESARFVDVSIPNGVVGDVVKVSLYFAARWLMVSEVEFDLSGSSSSTGSAEPVSALGLPVSVSSPPPVSYELTGERAVAIATGCLAALAILLLTIAVIVLIGSRRPSSGCHGYGCHGSDQGTPATTGSASDNRILEDSFGNPAEAADEWRHLPPTQSTTTDDCSDVTSSVYATPLVTSRPGKVRHGLLSVFSFASPPPPPPPPQGRSSTPTFGCHVTAAESGSSGSLLGLECLETAEEIERERISFIRGMKRGAYGEICLCEMLRCQVDDHVTVDFDDAADARGRQLTVVKILSDQEDENDRSDFCWEASSLFALRGHANVVRLFGVIRQAAPQCIVMEYMPYGDLEGFLRQFGRHSPEGDSAPLSNARLSHGCLVYMATQISSAMRLLESRGLVHRQLTARSCLVGERFLVKLSDFRLCRTIDFRSEANRKLPLRWLAPESILLGRFSSKSDVWSYAVTLWQIVTLCHSDPFGHVTVDELIDCARRAYSGGGGGEPAPRLGRPEGCPSELYDLMVQCWDGSEDRRPTFAEIHAFLKVRGLGYCVENDGVSLRVLEGLGNTGSGHGSGTSVSTDDDETVEIPTP